MKYISAFPHNFEFCEINSLLLILTGWEFVTVGVAVAGCLSAKMVDLETSPQMNLFSEMNCIQAAELC